jgi:hypothetical protein
VGNLEEKMFSTSSRGGFRHQHPPRLKENPVQTISETENTPARFYGRVAENRSEEA